MKKIYFIVFVVSLPLIVSAQCTNQVNHLAGSATVNGINVTVTHSGIFSNLNYCNYIGPYYIGNNGLNSGHGSYSFSFSPPASGVKLSIGAASNNSFGREETFIVVNGSHYPVAGPLTPNTCEPVADITAAGNITGCSQCAGSGCDDLFIPGPISSLALFDSIISGDPAGITFAIFICEGVVTALNDHYEKHAVTLYPNPVGEMLNISVHDNEFSELFIYNASLKKMLQQDFVRSASVNTDKLSAGIYFYEVKSRNGFSRFGKFVKEQ